MSLRRPLFGFPFSALAILLAVAMVFAQDVDPAPSSEEPPVADPTATEVPIETPVLTGPPTAEVEFALGDNSYAPVGAALLASGTARWVNRGTQLHTVTSTTGLFQSSVLEPGQEFSLLIAGTGDFFFFCEFHPNMQGVLRVVAEGTTTEQLAPVVLPTPDLTRPTPGPTSTPVPLPTSNVQPVDPLATPTTGTGPALEATATATPDPAASATPELIASPTPNRQPTARAGTSVPTPRPEGTTGRQPTPTGARGPSTATVEMRDTSSFTPRDIQIGVGGRVIWTNSSGVGHRIVAASFNSPVINPGATAQFRFESAGVYSMVCTLHSSMTGTITVQ